MVTQYTALITLITDFATSHRLCSAFSKLKVEAQFVLERTRQGAKEETLCEEKTIGAHGRPACSRQSYIPEGGCSKKRRLQPKGTHLCIKPCLGAAVRHLFPVIKLLKLLVPVSLSVRC